MSSSVYTINVNTPFLLGVPNSRVSPEWIRLLGALVTSNNSGVTSDDTTVLVFTARKPPDPSRSIDDLRNSQQFASMRGLIRDLMQRIESLESQIGRKTAPPSVGSDDIAALLRPRTASAAATCAISDDNATNATMYPVWASAIAGQVQSQTSSTKWTFNPSTGRMTATQLVATAGFGCNGAAPQTAVASGGALATYGAGANGYDTAAHAQALYNLVVSIRSALVANGIMS